MVGVAVASIFTSGCCTTPLLESVRRTDPDVTAIHAAYHRDDEMILDYSVGVRKTDNYQVGPGRYWASLSISNLLNGHEVKYVVHRSPLTRQRGAGWRQIQIIDLKDKIVPSSDGHLKIDAAEAFVRAIPEDQLPLLTTLNTPGALDANFSWIVLSRPSTGRRTHVSVTPYSTYIPAQNYPKLILLFPFAVVGDILTAPLLLFALRVDG